MSNSIRKLLVDNNIAKLATISASRTIFLYSQVYLAIFIAMYIGLHVKSLIIYFLSIIFIAGRQHSLYILNHDASHTSLFKTKKMNKHFATIFSNFIMFHHPEAWSFVQWRRVHLMHHRYLFTNRDPNYLGRQQAGDTERTYTTIQLLWSCLLAIPQTIKSFFWGKQDWVNPKTNQFVKGGINHLAALLMPITQDDEMEMERRFKLVFFSLALIFICYFHLWHPFLLFWLLPMYTIYPMILKFHDLTEHHWEVISNDLNVNTRSEKRHFLAKVLLSCLPRNFHREHHMFPKICVVNLPKLNKLLT